MPDSAPSASPGQNGFDSGAPHAQAADGFQRQLAGVVECSDDTRPSLAEHHPCFVHSWLAPHPTAPGIDESADDDSADNLTRRLAQTAVGVRAMSKLLGRARIRTSIQSVLVVTRARDSDNRLIGLTRQLALYLMLRQRKCESESGRGLVVYVDAQLRHSKRFDAAGIAREHPELFRPVLPRRRTSSNLPASAAAQGNSSTAFESGRNGQSPGSNEGQLRYWTREMCTGSPHLFDVVVTLGGDGTVLFASWLFQRIVPPVLPFGSPGFLATFNFGEHRAVLETAIETGIRVNLRMRFTCTVYRGKGKGKVKKGLGDAGAMLRRALEKGGWEALEGGDEGTDKEIMPYATRPEESFEVLNDVVVDRGLSSYISLLELFGDEHHMTTAQADGLCIATPTGSTAYSLAAGGSLVNPEIPAMLITPICPHTLSFRPILLPDTMELRICVPYNSRSSAWASFDGRGRIELKQGDHLKVTASKYPFPTVCSDKPSTDWFRAISRTLRWNERERQKSFVVVEEDSAPSKRESGDGTEEEEEETFDIDDLPVAGQDVTSSSTSTSSEPSVDSAAADSLARGGIALDSDSPDRFHSRIPHPLRPPLHHVRYTGQGHEHTHVVVANERRGDRDDIHRRRDGDVDAASMRTPRADTAPERTRDTAFAVENASHSVVS